MVYLRFENKNAAAKVVTIRCSSYSVDDICMWYAAYNAGDKYDVYIDGHKRVLDDNGLIIGSVL